MAARVREQRGLFCGSPLALGAYGFVATLQPDPEFSRILAAYGGVFVAGSLLWGVVVDGFHPDRFDGGGAVICLRSTCMCNSKLLIRSPTSRPMDVSRSAPSNFTEIGAVRCV